MLFVTVIQTLAVGFTITSLIKDTLMLSPEQQGVTCNITTQMPPSAPSKKITISAENLVVYWGWRSLKVRWNFKGLEDTQIWLKESYHRTYDSRCVHSHHNRTTTLFPTVLQNEPTPSPSAPITNMHNITSPQTTRRKLLQYETPAGSEDIIAFEVPLSLQYNSVFTNHLFLPSVFYPLPPLQTTATYGQKHVEYVYPFKVTKVYSEDHEYTKTEDFIAAKIPTKSPTVAPTNKGCSDLEIVIQTGKSYFSLLVCGLLCESVAFILLIPPTCLLVTMQLRRLIKQIVIGLNTVGFMLLLMAFAIWFAYFSTNINQVIEAESNTQISVCILGEPVFGDSVAYLLTGWLLIGFATMSACYLSNRPKRWYRFIRRNRNYGMSTKLNANETILEEPASDSDSEYDDDYDEFEEEDEDERLHTLVNRTPSDSSGSNATYMTADASFPQGAIKGDTYPIPYSPP